MVRRVVVRTGEDPDKVDVSDGDVGDAISLERFSATEIGAVGRAGSASFSAWQAGDGWQLEPGVGDVSFRIVRFLPIPADAAVDPTVGMHATQTVDLGSVLSGEVTLVLESGEEIALQSGDVFVLEGVPHAWRNTSGVPCIASIVMLSRLAGRVTDR
ncbi:MAG: cupin domain-containing protein [Pseudonocardiaceae bacterium]|nr:MAG: cupin domain-containing protein [Pseudonocardiaceae bacterium]